MANGFYIGDNRKQRYGKVFQNNRKDSIWTVSYTHLTLPTKA